MTQYVIHIFILLFISSSIKSQNKDYWIADTTEQTKIYTINFVNSYNGWAEAALGNILKSTDGGNTWQVISEFQKEVYKSSISKNVEGSWNADIYCAVMKTSDGGESWIPHSGKQEEHFCGVYFKDENSGWKVAKEFLSRVVSTIKTSIQKGDYEFNSSIIKKCREYYTAMDEGWSIGWCYRNLVRK